MNILQFSTKGMAIEARKVLASAIANAENNHNLDVDSLVVSEASVGKSIVMKRFATRGRGKSTRILKPFSRLRIVINRTWDSRWYAEGADYGRLLLEDLKMRAFIMKTLPQAAISKVVIDRPAKLCRVSIFAARPGVII
eukprot:gene29170-32722_t